MTKGRLEAFSDGVFAIIITIMVLELKVPPGHELAALRPMLPLFCAYALSFLHVGIYWNNHHHMLAAVQRINGKTLWANLHLLFWLSLVPFTTAWMGESHLAPAPTAIYGGNLLLASIAYYVLAQVLIANQPKDSPLPKAVGRDRKGQISALVYAIAVVCALFVPSVAAALFVLVALMWLIPDSRIESSVNE